MKRAAEPTWKEYTSVLFKEYDKEKKGRVCTLCGTFVKGC